MQNLKKYILNQQPVWRGYLSKINGIPAQGKIPFTIRRLTVADAENMGDLSANIYNNLKNGEECFIHKHPKEYYAKIFKDPDIHYIGVFVGEKLGGMSYIRICRNRQSFMDEIPGCPINFFERRDHAQIAAFGADCVRPEYRGNNINQIMIAYRLELARKLSCTDAASIVDRNNHWNMPPYFNNGFHMFATGIDPADGGRIALMHHHINHNKTIPLHQSIVIPYNHFELIDKLLKRGFIGTAYNPQTSSITFMPTRRTTDIERNILAFISQRKGKYYV